MVEAKVSHSGIFRVIAVLGLAHAAAVADIDIVQLAETPDDAPAANKSAGKNVTLRKTTTITKTTSTTSTTATITTTTTTTIWHIHGGADTKGAFRGWLAAFRKRYGATGPCGVVPCFVPEPDESLMPKDLRGVRPKVVLSNGGDGGNVLSHGMGTGIMVEGIEAAAGDKDALKKGLALVKGWLGLVQGPEGVRHPLGGAAMDDKDPAQESVGATKVDSPPYGVSAIYPAGGSRSGVAAGVATWQYPLGLCGDEACSGSATDGDEDAVLGMIYIAKALGYPEDFVDMVMRALIAFASADLGFPSLYRTLPNGKRIFVPKGGSHWGGLLPPDGKFKTAQEPWCTSPNYFAPAHYRAFRDFAKKNWSPSFNAYLPKHLSGTPSSLKELTEAFDSAVTAGYNILYRSSCPSGSVSNWVGVQAPCPDNALNCKGVPWAHTPYVGPDKGKCSATGTPWGSYGKDASRVPWHVAMDYALFREESEDVTMYDNAGRVSKDTEFSSRVYLNRIAKQYTSQSKCDGGQPGKCLDFSGGSPWHLAFAFDPKNKPPDVTCPNVPERGRSWWVTGMAYPTFTAFVAPFEDIIPEESAAWIDTFSNICNFTDQPNGDICSTKLFDVSQAVVSTMIMAGRMLPLESSPVEGSISDASEKEEQTGSPIRLGSGPAPTVALAWGFACAVVLAVTAGALVFKCMHQKTRSTASY